MLDTGKLLSITLFLILFSTLCYAQSTSRVQGIILLDEGSSQGRIRKVDCVGGNIVCSKSGSTGTVTISSGGSSFVDSTFEITDEVDVTKILNFDVGTNVTTGNTRVLKVPDSNGTMALDSIDNSFSASQTITGDLNITNSTTSLSSILNKQYIDDEFSISNAISSAGNGLNLGGTDEAVTLNAHVSNFASLSEGTVMGWFKTSANGVDTILALSDSGDGSSEFAIRCPQDTWDGVLRVIYREAGAVGFDVETNSTYNDGNWHHFAYTADSGGNAIYIDGSAAAVTYSTGNSSTQAFFNDVNNIDAMSFGRNTDSSGQQWFYTGVLDEIAIYNIAIDATDVADAYNSGRGVELNTSMNFPTSTTSMGTGLVGLWHMNESSGTNVADSSGNSYDGTTVNMEDGDWITAKVPNSGTSTTQDILKHRIGDTYAGNVTLGNATADVLIDAQDIVNESNNAHSWTVAGTEYMNLDADRLSADKVMLTRTAGSSNREEILKAQVSDSGNSAFIITNGTAVDSRFIPNFAGYYDTTDDAFSLQFSGLTSAGNDASDSSSLGLIRFFTSRTDSATDPMNGTLSAIQNRKLFTFENHATIVMEVDSNGVLATASGRIVNTTRVTTTYTALATDHNIFADTDGGAFTVTLPVGVAGTEYRIMNTGTSANNLTITPDGSELLIGVNSSFALGDGESLIIVYETTEGWF